MTRDQIEKVEALLNEAAEYALKANTRHGKLCAASIYTILAALFDTQGMEELAQNNFLHNARTIERIKREEDLISQGQN